MKAPPTLRIFLLAALLSLSFQGCQILALPFKILDTGLLGVKWVFQNAGGLIPLAGYLVMEDPAPSLPPGSGVSPGDLLRSPPQGALALVLVPPQALGDPGLEEALGRKFPGAGRFLPLKFSRGGPLPPPPSRPALPLLAAAPLAP